MKRTLMLKDEELLDFEVNPETGKVRILDAPDADDAQLVSLGLGGPDMDVFVAQAICNRSISESRDDLSQVLDAFGARSVLELSFMGHGLSLIDKLWYRAPGGSERWEDINFFDNDWDGTYRLSVLTRDYKSLASCSPDIPDLTTKGHLRKAWERSGECIQLIKEPLFESGADIEGAYLGAELCRLLFGQDDYQPLNVVERYGRRFTASPLMIGRDEELVQSWRLFAMGGYNASETACLIGPAKPQSIIDVISRAGVPNASAHVAMIFAFKSLALLQDIHAGNFGIIRNLETGVCRAVSPFDYDRSFGFPREDFQFDWLCDDPELAVFLCACFFSDLDSSWDWSWYDPQVLEGFEDRIGETYASYTDFPPNFGKLVAQLFVVQRDYVNGVASKRMTN